MRKLYPVALFLILAACSVFVSGYRAASIEANQHAKDYAVARVAVDDAHTAGKLTPDQWRRYEAIRDTVRAASVDRNGALVTWRTTGRKPGNYDSAAAAVFAAEQKMIDLKNEVTP
jgi:hypothetical protein